VLLYNNGSSLVSTAAAVAYTVACLHRQLIQASEQRINAVARNNHDVA
jgi:hypothetical protein